MAITAVHQPDEVSLSKGRISYGLQGSGPVITAGVKARNYVNFYQTPQNGDTLTLSWNGQTIRFTFRTVVGNDPLDLPIAPVSDSWATSLIPRFETLAAIAEDFTISLVPDDVISSLAFEARQAGAHFNFVQTLVGGTELATWRFATIPFVAGTDPVLRANYGLYFELWCQRADRSGFERIAQETLDTDANGYVEVPVSDYLHTHLTADWPNFFSPLPEVVRATQSHRQYYVRFAEAWGEPQLSYHLATAPTRQVYFGGVDFERKASFSLYSLVRATDDADEDRCLRFGPKWRFVRPDEPQYLTYLALRGAITDLMVEFTLEFDDSTRMVTVDRLPLVDLVPFEKVIIPVGMSQVDLAAVIPTGRRLSSYSVRLLSQAGYHSEPYQYIVDYQHKPYSRFFTYLSSLGGVETLVVDGKGSEELKVFSAQAERVLHDLDGPLRSQFLDYDLQQQTQYEVATGWQTPESRSLMRDFYRSPEKFQVWPLRALPIRITSTSVLQQKDGENQIAHKFAYEYPFRDSFFSQDFDGEPEPVVPPGFQGSGEVNVVLQPKPFAIDPTISNLLRNLTGVDINKFFQAYGWGNHAQGGYLTPQTGAEIFAPKHHDTQWKDLVGSPPILKAGLGIDMTQYPKKGVMTATASVDGQSFTLTSALKKLIKTKK